MFHVKHCVKRETVNELGGNRIFKDVTTYLDAALASGGRGDP